MTLMVVDSGIGGLSILREVRVILPRRRIVYIGDDAGFPYGGREEGELATRVVSLFERHLAEFDPELAIVACNTASTMIMPALREAFDLPIVGTVPPIKPAARQSVSRLVSVLATPGTVRRPYVAELIRQHGADCEINLVGSKVLAGMAERHMQGKAIDSAALAEAIRPCFVEADGRRTDIVILGCTHYPFLVHEMRKLAPWPVDWLEPAEAIARRALSLLGDTGRFDTREDIAIMTSGLPGPPLQKLLAGFGLTAREPLNDAALSPLSG